MREHSAKVTVERLLQATEIQINGKNPWDIQVNNNHFYERVLRDGSLGLGESYMDKEWDCSRLDQFFDRIISANLESKVKKNLCLLFKIAIAKMFNLQSKKRAFIVGERHYDLGNDLFESMLDQRMNYTCGYWAQANNLDDAQLAKLELVCKKLMLKPGMKLLDVGCGFGALAKHAAQHYGVDVVGVSISRAQCEWAKKNCQGLPVEIRLQDYREVTGKFDRIASLGMFEHVGHLNHQTYMQTVANCLKDDGLFLLHTIGDNVTSHSVDPWTGKYIFPNGLLPSIAQIARACENIFIMEDWHNFGVDYDKTLMAWHANFNAHWDRLKGHYDERFHRMWDYYLLMSAGSFRARHIQLWQIVFSKPGFVGRYHAPR